MRLKLAEQEDMTKDHHIREKIRERQAEVDRMLAEIGAETIEVAEATPYAFRYRLRYAGDTGGSPPRSSRSRAPRCCPSARRSS